VSDQMLDDLTGLVLDESRLLQDFGDDPAVLGELKDLFLQHIPPLMDEIKTAHQAGDGELMAHSSHSLKGAASTYGAERLAKAAKAVELMARSSDLAAAGQALPRLKEEVTLLIERIRQLSDGS